MGHQRRARPLAWARDLVRDGLFALRQFRRGPLVAAAVVLTLGVGIGATTSIFTTVNGVLLRPLPYHDADRLVAIAGLSYRGEFLQLKEHARTFEPAAYSIVGDVSVTGRGEPLRLVSAALSPEMLPVLGATPLIGRGFVDSEGRPGAEPVILLSAALWRTQFAGDPAVVGQRPTVDGTPRTIVGVMPARFAFPSDRTQIWTPLPEGTPRAHEITRRPSSRSRQCRAVRRLGVRDGVHHPRAAESGTERRLAAGPRADDDDAGISADARHSTALRERH